MPSYQDFLQNDSAAFDKYLASIQQRQQVPQNVKYIELPEAPKPPASALGQWGKMIGRAGADTARMINQGLEAVANIGGEALGYTPEQNQVGRFFKDNAYEWSAIANGYDPSQAKDVQQGRFSPIETPFTKDSQFSQDHPVQNFFMDQVQGAIPWVAGGAVATATGQHWMLPVWAAASKHGEVTNKLMDEGRSGEDAMSKAVLPSAAEGGMFAAMGPARKWLMGGRAQVSPLVAGAEGAFEKTAATPVGDFVSGKAVDLLGKNKLTNNFITGNLEKQARNLPQSIAREAAFVGPYMYAQGKAVQGAELASGAMSPEEFQQANGYNPNVGALDNIKSVALQQAKELGTSVLVGAGFGINHGLAERKSENAIAHKKAVEAAQASAIDLANKAKQEADLQTKNSPQSLIDGADTFEEIKINQNVEKKVDQAVQNAAEEIDGANQQKATADSLATIDHINNIRESFDNQTPEEQAANIQSLRDMWFAESNPIIKTAIKEAGIELSERLTKAKQAVDGGPNTIDSNSSFNIPPDTVLARVADEQIPSQQKYSMPNKLAIEALDRDDNLSSEIVGFDKGLDKVHQKQFAKAKEATGADLRAVIVKGEQSALLRDIGKAFGRHITFFDSEHLAAPDGFVDPSNPRNIYLKARSASSTNFILGHEILHSLSMSNGESYDRLVKDLMPYIDKEGYANEISSLRKGGKFEGQNRAEIHEEVIGNLVGEFVSNPEKLKLLAQDNPTLFKRIADAAIKIFNKIKSIIINKPNAEAVLSQIDPAMETIRQYLGDRAKAENAFPSLTEPHNGIHENYTKAIIRSVVPEQSIEAFVKQSGYDSLREMTDDMLQKDGDKIVGQKEIKRLAYDFMRKEQLPVSKELYDDGDVRRTKPINDLRKHKVVEKDRSVEQWLDDNEPSDRQRVLNNPYMSEAEKKERLLDGTVELDNNGAIRDDVMDSADSANAGNQRIQRDREANLNDESGAQVDSGQKLIDAMDADKETADRSIERQMAAQSYDDAVGPAELKSISQLISASKPKTREQGEKLRVNLLKKHNAELERMRRDLGANNILVESEKEDIRIAIEHLEAEELFSPKFAGDILREADVKSFKDLDHVPPAVERLLNGDEEQDFTQEDRIARRKEINKASAANDLARKGSKQELERGHLDPWLRKESTPDEGYGPAATFDKWKSSNKTPKAQAELGEKVLNAIESLRADKDASIDDLVGYIAKAINASRDDVASVMRHMRFMESGKLDATTEALKEKMADRVDEARKSDESFKRFSDEEISDIAKEEKSTPSEIRRALDLVYQDYSVVEAGEKLRSAPLIDNTESDANWTAVPEKAEDLTKVINLINAQDDGKAQPMFSVSLLRNDGKGSFTTKMSLSALRNRLFEQEKTGNKTVESFKKLNASEVKLSSESHGRESYDKLMQEANTRGLISDEQRKLSDDMIAKAIADMSEAQKKIDELGPKAPKEMKDKYREIVVASKNKIAAFDLALKKKLFTDELNKNNQISPEYIEQLASQLKSDGHNVSNDSLYKLAIDSKFKLSEFITKVNRSVKEDVWFTKKDKTSEELKAPKVPVPSIDSYKLPIQEKVDSKTNVVQTGPFNKGEDRSKYGINDELATALNELSKSMTEATAKKMDGKEPSPQDIFTGSELVEANGRQYVVGKFKSGLVQSVFQKIANAFGADLKVVRDFTGEMKGMYIPKSKYGKPQIVVNVDSGFNLSHVFAHELFHHLANKVTGGEYDKFTAAIEKSIKADKYADLLLNHASPEELHANLYSEVFRKPEFWREMSRSDEGVSLARKLLYRTAEMITKVTKAVNEIKRGQANAFELDKVVKQFYGQDGLYRPFIEIMSQALSSNDLRHFDVKYLDGQTTDAVKNDIKEAFDSGKEGLKETAKKLYPEGSLSKRAIMDKVEDLLKAGMEWIRDNKPAGIFADYGADAYQATLAYKAMNDAEYHADRAYLSIVKKNKDVWKDADGKPLSKERLEAIHDGIVRGKIDVTTDKGIESAKKLGLTNDQIEVLKQYKEFVDPIFDKLKTIYPDLQKLESHYGQSIKWFKGSGVPFDQSIESVVGGERFVDPDKSKLEGDTQYLQGKNLNETTAALAEKHGIHYEGTLDPHKLFVDYVRDANKLIALKEMVSEGLDNGVIKQFSKSDAPQALKRGFVKVDDPSFRVLEKMLVTPSYELRMNGKPIVDDAGVDNLSFKTKEEAQAYIDEHALQNTEVAPIEKSADMHTGDLYFKKDLARMLKVMLAEDTLRNGEVFGISGRNVMKLKNDMTSTEMMLSMFHAMTIGQELTASNASHNLQRLALNKGKGQATFGERLKGYNVFDAVKQSRELATLFESVMGDQDLAGNKAVVKKADELLGTNGVDLLDMLRQFYRHGGMIHQDTELRGHGQNYGQVRYKKESDSLVIGKNGEVNITNNKPSMDAIRDSLNDIYNNSLASGNSTTKALFHKYRASLLEAPTAWLMEAGIPKIKMAMFAKEYTLKLDQNKAALESGDITREQIARDTMKFVEDRFGEVNWKNQWINPSIKTAMQFMFRSFTWFTGSWKALGKAGLDVAKLGWFTMKGDKYELTDKGMWGANALITHFLTAGLVTAAYNILSGGNEVESDPETPTLTKLMFPRVDSQDPNKRIAIPSYITEAYKILSHVGMTGKAEPSKLITGRFNALINGIVDNIQGHDYRGVKLEGLDRLIHMVPLPISVATMKSSFAEHGANIGDALTALGGMSTAPAAALRSKATNAAFEERRKEYKGKEVTQDEMDEKNIVKQAAYAYGKGDKSKLDSLLAEGRISQQQYKNTIEKIPLINGKPNPKYRDQLSSAIKGLTLEGALKVWEEMSDNEQAKHKGEIMKKYMNMMGRKETPELKKKELKERMKELSII